MIQPKKHLGQHFLKDENIARKIVAALPEGTEALLEVGPGMGVLTKHLLALDIPAFYAVETDAEAVAYLKDNYPGLQGRIIHDDFLSFDLKRLFPGKFSIIGNFPYNISGPILFRVLEYRSQAEVVVGMFQKEVAGRVAAPHGSKTYGILSVLMQAFYQVEVLFTVSEKVFFPVPAVKSAVMRLTRNQTASLPCDESLFFDVVKTGFNQRRKMLRNALQKFGVKDYPTLGNMLMKRAEELSTNDFVELTITIQQAKNRD